jgi:hypothetical protein
LAQVLAARDGRLGFKVKWLTKTGEETGNRPAQTAGP